MTAANPALVDPNTPPRPYAGAVVSTPGPDPAEAARAQAVALRRLLEVQAALVDARSHQHAARRLVDRLARVHGFDEVAVAFVQSGRLQGLVRSGGAPADADLPAVRALLAAMHEALDQRCSVVTPAPVQEPLPRIRAAQEQLLGAEGGSVACVLLVPPRPKNVDLSEPLQPAGVLCAWRRGAAARPVSAREAAWLEHASAFASPVFGLLRQRERSLRWRAARLWSAVPGAHRRHAAPAAAALVLAAVLGLCLWPMPHEVGGRARVEGAVQRAVVAPVTGFLKQAHVRPGDTVKAGQLLVELADEDLNLEREKLQSQVTQWEGALAEANAKADRAQVMMNLARLQQARAQLSLVDSQLERTRLHAPFDAVVVHGDLSQRLGSPLKEGEELLTLAPAGQYRVIVEVDEKDIGRVSAGQGGSLALAALPWDTLALRVRQVTPMAVTAEGRSVFEVEAEVPEPPATLRPGLSGSGRIEVGQRPLLVGWAFEAGTAARRMWWRVWG